MRRPMAHRARRSDRLARPLHRRPPSSAPGRRRFLGPVVIAIAGLVIVVAGVTGTREGTPELGAGASQGALPVGLVADATGAPTTEALPRSTAPPCAQADELTALQRPGDWASTILDTALMLAPDASPDDLVPVTDAGIDGHGRIRQLVVDDLRALAGAARAAGTSISVDSAYRSYEQQVASFRSYVTGYGETEALLTVARPGHSEHQLGTTIDFAGDLAWLAAHAPAFGFVLSYPPDASPGRTCYRAEAWHFRYVGREEAQAVERSGLSLREWLWLHRP